MSTVFLIPSLLAEDGTDALPFYITDAVKQCQVLFVENERTTRRFLKQFWRTVRPGEDISIDAFEWFVIGDDTNDSFRNCLKAGKNIGIVSEAGCPGVADPGQALVAIAQEAGAKVKPLVGPSSILLALMASGMNGQEFYFRGYLPIDIQQRTKQLKELEQHAARNQCTQVFIETPYRNNQLLETILKTCAPQTRLCIAADITGSKEQVITRTIAGWKKQVPDLHKKPVIFLLYCD